MKKVKEEECSSALDYLLPTMVSFHRDSALHQDQDRVNKTCSLFDA